MWVSLKRQLIARVERSEGIGGGWRKPASNFLILVREEEGKISGRGY